MKFAAECCRGRRQQQQQPHRSPSSDNSKSTVVVLYRGAREHDSTSTSCSTLKSRAHPVKTDRSASQESPERSRAAAAAAESLVSRPRRKARSRNKGWISRVRSSSPTVDAGAKANRKSRRQRGGVEWQPCRTPSDSKNDFELMARRPNTKGKSLPHQAAEDGPDVAHLMQQSRYPKETGDNLLTPNPNDERRKFPFRSTASDSLKIIPNQVVFETKKVSVLVAKPDHAKVNVKAEPSTGNNNNHASPIRNVFDLPPGVTASTVDRLQMQHRPQSKPRNQPAWRSKEELQMQQQPQKHVEERRTAPDLDMNLHVPKLDDVPLASLGFTAEQPINWKKITLPEKADLYRELERRITTFKNADCIVHIGNDEFHCHLLVLQSYSTFFDDQNIKEVDLTGSSVTSTSFSIIYDWMISPTSESCHLLRRDNILEIFLAAQHLGIKELEEQCWAFIDNEDLFSEDTAFLLYMEAQKIGNSAVMELMVPRIMKFFLMLVSTKDFLELSVQELCLLLRSNYISVNSEMEVLMSAVRWLMHDWEERKEYLLQIMKCIRFGLIAPWQLVDVKRNPENPEFIEIMSYPEVQKMVDDGLAFVIIKYWYGNQTEDYYHWIDLLGLTEPTNRNWAGEDKNYVTYREFLLYLEEYQTTKIADFKNKKQEKPLPPNSPPKEEDSSLQTTPVTRCRTDQNSKMGEYTSANNSKSGKHSSERMTSNGVPSCMMMPPELLEQYLSSLNRNGSKPVSKVLNGFSSKKK